MKKIFLATLLACGLLTASAQVYMTRTGKVQFFSKTPLENIEAVNNETSCALNASTGELRYIVPVKSFKFEKALMQEHFNENYMESDKYPRATFKGKINEKIDVSKDGTYPVTVTGDLNVHNVTQHRTIPGKVSVKGGVVSMTSEFMVKCADHHITIPRLVFHNIAESLKITVSATYAASK